jgi:hypothetical protein
MPQREISIAQGRDGELIRISRKPLKRVRKRHPCYQKDLVLSTRVVRLMRRARSPIHGIGHLHPPVEPQFQPNSDMAAVQKLLTLLVEFLFLALGTIWSNGTFDD